MSIVVDRIEGARAVLEICGEQVEIPAAALPEGAGEGSVLILSSAREAGDGPSAAEQRLERLRSRTPAEDVIDL